MQTQDQVVQLNFSIPYFTGIPEDVVVNTWHAIRLVGDIPDAADYAAFGNRLVTFYQAVYGGSGLSRALHMNMGGATTKCYRLWDPEPRVPAYTGAAPITGTVGAGGTAPTETAICLSYKADYVNGIPPARQRGRIYLGGFASPLTASTASSFPEVAAASRTAIANAAVALRTGLLTDGWQWVVLSPTNVQALLQETFVVTSGWIDNAADTQRRRGQAATARTTWS